MDLIADVKNLRNLGIAISISILFSAFTSLNLAIDRSPPAFIPASSAIFAQEFFVSWTKGYSDLRELSEEADVILKGKVVASRLCLLGSILGGILFTEHVLSIEEVLKGDVPGQRLSVIQTGGYVFALMQHVVDDPLIPIGAEMVVFLERSGETYIIMGGPQGRFARAIIERRLSSP